MKVKISHKNYIENGEKHHNVSVKLFYDETNKKSYEKMNDFEKAGLMAEYIGEMSIEIEKCFKELGHPDEYIEKWQDLLTRYIQHDLFPFRQGKLETALELFF